jgi:hypothetical protein
MQLRLLFSRWTKLSSLLLMGGAMAWAAKLGVIISTNGRIIDTGAASILMTTGTLMLLVGSTGIGTYLCFNRAVWLRTIAILLSPVFVFGSILFLAKVTGPLFQNSSLWYAQQEGAIGVVAVVYMIVGFLLFKRYKPVIQ